MATNRGASCWHPCLCGHLFINSGACVRRKCCWSVPWLHFTGIRRIIVTTCFCVKKNFAIFMASPIHLMLSQSIWYYLCKQCFLQTHGFLCEKKKHKPWHQQWNLGADIWPEQLCHSQESPLRRACCYFSPQQTWILFIWPGPDLTRARLDHKLLFHWWKSEKSKRVLHKVWQWPASSQGMGHARQRRNRN